MEYDVFISCKSEDYKYAEEIYDFLTVNGINTFLASKELRNLGDSEYRRAISNAMKSTYHMIVFASKAEYVESPWVYYEWDMYINAMLKGFKKGQILTILKDLVIEDINMDLWKYESFKYVDYKEKLLSYVETPNFIERREETKRKRLEKERLEEERLNLQRQKEQKDLEANIRISVSALNNSEDKVRISREQLLLQIQAIDDENVKQDLYDLLDNAGPLHVENRSLKESISINETLIAKLQTEVNEKGVMLDEQTSDIKRLQHDLCECVSQKKDLETRCADLENRLKNEVLLPNSRTEEIYQDLLFKEREQHQEYGQKLEKSKRLLHIIYCSFIAVLIGGFTILFFTMDNVTKPEIKPKTKSETKSETKPETKLKLPNIFNESTDFEYQYKNPNDISKPWRQNP